MLSSRSDLHSDTVRAHSEKGGSTSQKVDGEWWKPYSNTDPYLILSSSLLTKRLVDLQFTTSTGQFIKVLSLPLEPHATVRYRLEDLLGALPVGGTGGIVISYKGPERSILAYAGVEDFSNGFSAGLPIEEIHAERARDLSEHKVIFDAPGVMYGRPDTHMLFPSGTYFRPYILLHNISVQQRTVTFTATNSGTLPPQAESLLNIVLKPKETRVVQIDSLPSSLTANTSAGMFNLSAAYDGHDGDLQLSVGSVDQTGNYVFEVQPQAEAWTVARTLCFWTISGDSDTMISLWNYTNDVQQLKLTLMYRGSKYVIPIRLAAHSDNQIDIGSLYKRRIPDASGSVIPTDVTEGSAILSDANLETNHITVALNTATFNVRNGACTNQCGTCGGVTSFTLTPAPITVALAAATQVTGQLTYSWGSVYSVTNGTWTSSPIAPVSPNGLVSGVELGSGQTSDSIDNLPVNLGYICMGNQLSCPTSTLNASGLLNVGYAGNPPTNQNL